ncbi:peflin [Trichogramma pretiosum]|uniref:peflin n=1 Tax=Trichogramma pretiosum TaxID=7493 RepID=UPI0006C9D41B|nr:peflin [Trichogramma pretiosum]
MYPGLQNVGTGDEPPPHIQQWFALADNDRNGVITAKELQRVLANGQGGTFSDKCCQLLTGLFGKQTRGSINYVEFQGLFNYINSWLGIFKGFDKDNSGTIQEGELAEAFTQMGYRFSPEFYSNVMRMNDQNSSGNITVDQFIVLCIRVQKFTEEFRKRDTGAQGVINIGFEDFLTITLGCDYL